MSAQIFTLRRKGYLQNHRFGVFWQSLWTLYWDKPGWMLMVAIRSYVAFNILPTGLFSADWDWWNAVTSHLPELYLLPVYLCGVLSVVY